MNTFILFKSKEKLYICALSKRKKIMFIKNGFRAVPLLSVIQHSISYIYISAYVYMHVCEFMCVLVCVCVFVCQCVSASRNRE